jgi:hypothetical protein
MKYIIILMIGLVACSEDGFEYKIVCLNGEKVTGESRSLKKEENTDGYMLGAMHLCTELDYMAFVGDSVMFELYGQNCAENANALLKMNGY